MPISINKIYSIWNYIKLKESKYTSEFKWDFTIWNSYYLDKKENTDLFLLDYNYY